MAVDDKMKKLTEFFPEFKSRIEKIPVDKIDFNPYNPRKKFGQEEEDDLVESINSRGVLVPIIVYEKLKEGEKRYVLLEGQRRVQACRKLGREEIPAHIISEEPSLLENLSIMFHIHNIHEDWTDVAIMNSMEKIIQELKMDRNNLSREDIKILKKWTSLSDYKIKKYRDLLKYPDPVLKRFQESESKETPEVDLDILLELRKPLNQMCRILPDLYKDYPEEKVVDIFVEKKKNNMFSTNKEIRDISKIISNAKSGKIRLKLAEDKLRKFFEDPNVSISQIYSETAEPFEQKKRIIKLVSKLKTEIGNLDFVKLTRNEQRALKNELKGLIQTIKNKMSEKHG
jgi:ParB family chromosome partitioning protein